jgi:hypothetical protein
MWLRALDLNIAGMPSRLPSACSCTALRKAAAWVGVTDEPAMKTWSSSPCFSSPAGATTLRKMKRRMCWLSR